LKKEQRYGDDGFMKRRVSFQGAEPMGERLSDDRNSQYNPENSMAAASRVTTPSPNPS